MAGLTEECWLEVRLDTLVLAKTTENHFNLPGHSISDMQFVILEKIYSKDPGVRKERESLFIKNFNTLYKGMNKMS